MIDKLRMDIDKMVGAAQGVFYAEDKGDGLSEAIGELRMVCAGIFYDRAYPEGVK